MFNNLRLSYNLLRLANSVLDRRKEKFKKELEGLDLNERVLEETLDCLIGIKEHLVRKMSIHWLKKKSIILPEDLPKVEKAYKLAKDNRGIDYLTFDSPVEIIDKFEEKAQIEFDKLIKPDSLPELYDKVDLGDGVTVYTVEDTKEGQYAVRKLADSHFGERFDNWCIIYRLRDEEDVERDDMGMMVKSFETYWKRYSSYPKRIAFKDGKFFAFCANSQKEILWWDQNDDHFEYIPKHKHLGDDQNFIYKHIVKGLVDGWKSRYISGVNLVKNRHTPIEILIEISKNGSYEACQELARNSNVNEEILVNLSNREENVIRQLVAQHIKTPVDTLAKLSNDEENIIRQLVAQNLKTPVDILIKLSRDKSWAVRLLVSQNPNTPKDTVIELSSDINPNVCEHIAMNPNTPAEALVKLSNSELYFVRQLVAKHVKTPVDTLAKLSNDEDYWVRRHVAENLATTEDILVKLSRDKESFVRRAVAMNSKTSIKTLVELSKDEDANVRKIIAKLYNMPVEVLVELSKDEEVNVRSAIVDNDSTPNEVLHKLFRDEDTYVRVRAIQRLKKRGIDV